jgi:ATP-binding cassette subfamily B protein
LVGYTTWYFGNIVDSLMNRETNSQKMIIYMLILYLILQLMILGVNFLYTVLTSGVWKKLSINLYEKLLKYSLRDFSIKENEEDHKAFVSSVMIQDAQNYIDWFIKNQGVMVKIVLRITAFVTILFFYNRYIGIIVLAEVILFFFVSRMWNRKIEDASKQFAKGKEKYLYEYQNHINSRLEYANALKDNLLMKNICDTNKSIENETVVFNIRKAKNFFGNQMLRAIIMFTCLGLEIVLCNQNIISVGMIIASMELISLIEGDMEKSIVALQEIAASKSLKHRLCSILNSQKREGKAVDKRWKSIIIKDLMFSYDGKRQIFHKCNISFQRGKSYAIIGESGSGKSTLMRIMLGELSNYGGEIRIDENVLEKGADDFIYEAAYLNQNFYLFERTIYENICFDIPERWEKLKASGFWEILCSNITDFSYQIEENGKNLSGGQRQIIAIARAIASEKSILILDESFSALDEELFHTLEKALLDMDGITCIFITHRYDNLSNYQNIYKKDAQGGFSIVV